MNRRNCILIVDDNIDNLELAEILLHSEGYDVRVAQDASEAMETLRYLRPDLILMDVQLPGMDGLELTRRLRRIPILDGVIIVALSAYAMTSDKANALEAGCDGYMTKPIDTRTFPSTVRAFLDRSRTVSLNARP